MMMMMMMMMMMTVIYRLMACRGLRVGMSVICMINIYYQSDLYRAFEGH